MADITKDELLRRLKHFDDPTFTFESVEHVYHLNGQKLTSATTYLDRFVKPFDEEYWSKRKADEGGVTQEEILAKWKAKRDRACDIGTMTHEFIEHFYEGAKPKMPEDPQVKEKVAKFMKIYESKLKQLKPVASEVRVFSRRWPVCGTFDQLFLYEGQVIVGDWKTNEKIKTDKDFCFGYLQGPFSKWKENEVNKYSIQISLYQLILEEAGISSDYGFICHLPPGEDEPKVYKLHNFKEQLRAHLDSELHLTTSPAAPRGKTKLF